MTIDQPILSDQEIVDLYWERNEEAISQTDRKYHSYLMTVAQHILHNTQDSEECLNDTYLRTWNSIPPTRPNVLQAFLATVMRRCAFDAYRKHTGRKSVPRGLLVSFEDLKEVYAETRSDYSEQECRQLAEVINEYLSELPSRTRYVFISRYYFAHPIKQIAEQLGCSIPTVHREIAQIKRSLAEFLAKEGFTV